MVTPLPMALARIAQEPEVGETFSSLELEALSWAAMHLTQQDTVVEDHHPQF